LQQLDAAGVGLFHDALDFGVHQAGGLFAVVLVLHPLAADEDFFAGLTDGQGADGIAHAPFADHLAGHAGHAFDVVGSSGGDIVKDDLFRHTAAQQHHQVVAQVIA